MCIHNDDNDEYAVTIDSDYFDSDYDDIEEQQEEEQESDILFD